MIGDSARGFAWTRAVLGLPANEIHVCGDLSAVGLIRQLAAVCDDEFELRVRQGLMGAGVVWGCFDGRLRCRGLCAGRKTPKGGAGRGGVG
jgi:hypothetical protein